MCRTQCTSFYNLPCFLLFRCTDKIKKFFLMIVIPVIVFIVILGGCFSGVFSIGCFLRILGCITGIYLIMCIVKSCNKKKEKEEMKDKALEEARAEIAAEQIKKEPTIQPQDSPIPPPYPCYY